MYQNTNTNAPFYTTNSSLVGQNAQNQTQNGWQTGYNGQNGQNQNGYNGQNFHGNFAEQFDPSKKHVRVQEVSNGFIITNTVVGSQNVNTQFASDKATAITQVTALINA